MSTLYFHSERGDAELSGAEFHHLHRLCKQLAFRVLDLPAGDHAARLYGMLTPGHYLDRCPTVVEEHRLWCRWMETAMAVDGDDTDLLCWNGRRVGVFSLLLNTALCSEDPVMHLAARIAGQGEIHGYFEAADGHVIAGLIDLALTRGVFRSSLVPEIMPGRFGAPRPLGWDDVTGLLRDNRDGPVVMSYSVCDGFPNRRIARWHPPPDTCLEPAWAREAPGEWAALDETRKAEYRDEVAGELWSHQPAGIRWEQAVAGVRARAEDLRIDPANLAGARFTHGLSVLDVTAGDWRARFDAAFEETPVDVCS